VILDTDLAALYGVQVRNLNQQHKRNADRFPEDFAFQLTTEEFHNLKSQFLISSHGGRRSLSFAFTEHGAIVAASVLNSSRAVESSVFVVRAFVRLREVLTTHRELAARLAELETKLDTHDRAIAQLFSAIKQLMQPASPPKRRIGFVPKDVPKPKMSRLLTYAAPSPSASSPRALFTSSCSYVHCLGLLSGRHRRNFVP
jgi:ORF6N domain